MSPSDPRLPPDLVVAADLVKATALTVAERVCQTLAAQSQSVSKAADRNTMFAAQLALHRQLGSFRMQFQTRLDTRMLETLAPPSDSKRKPAPADWQSLTLVDDKEVDDRMLSDRLGQQIAQACEVELRELSGYMGRITGFGTADDERNPLRPGVIGHALHMAIGTVSIDPNERAVLTREFASVMAHAMPACYAAIVVELQSRGITPVGLQVRTVDGPGNQLPGLNSGYQSLRDDSPSTRHSGSDFHDSTHSGLTGRRSISGTRHAGTSGWQTGRGTGGSGGTTGYGSGARDSGGGMSSPAQEAHLMTLLRRLTSLTGESGSAAGGGLGGGLAGGGFAGGGGQRPTAAGGYSASSGLRSGLGDLRTMAGNPYTDPGTASAYAEDASAGLMAVNLIRAHRDELMQASNGKLDHMVIDVVGSLFDQILSDTRVPPQMARQIARLQLPVLRVALVDPTFFSSRKHPVRRFVNRIASLACAFDDFEEGPGKEFVTRVRDLVQEIVDGDFDQVDLYAAKLSELEAFIAQQAEAVVQDQGAVAVLETKESDLRTQQRYLIQLQSALSSVAMPEFLRTFLCQVWSQALVQSSRAEGVDGETVKRYRQAGRDLVMSVQPKGSPAMRKRFLMQLPTLMRDLNAGLKLIGWPEAATKEFFAQLMPAHAESLKVPAMSELDYNLLAKQMESVFNSAVPGQGDPAHIAAAAGTAMPADVEQRFTAEEAKRVGLIDEQAVDWDKPVDVDLSAEVPAAPVEPLNLGIDINLDLIAADPAEVSHGARLMDHLRIGFAYQMLLKDQWQKVRLTYMSPGRSFFVFTHGRNLQETISLTARMLARMCEAERLRAVENNYLMERATSRARQQLATLAVNTRS
ncbi:MAG: hypothetical protein CFE40_09255 [Burkholderiales bacterium PBB1]|nr:MAG: hypothetical protein CFE40_09255 [Burkholderiales bacterium PBB1]